MAVDSAKLNTLYGTTSDVIVEYDNEMQRVTVDIFDDWNMTVLGHYHGAQQLNDKVEYLGSPLQLTFGEAFQDKHIMLLDLKTLKKSYIKNTFSPQHLIILPQDVDKYKLKDNFVQVITDDITGKDKVDLIRKIEQMEDGPATFAIKPREKKASEDQKLLEDARSILFNEAEMVKMWTKTKGNQGLKEDRLESIGNLIIERVKSRGAK
jgi:hypothetical protein